MPIFRRLMVPTALATARIFAGAAALYMLRNDVGFMGNPLIVRRSSDNAETSVRYTSNGDLDFDALGSFLAVGAGGLISDPENLAASIANNVSYAANVARAPDFSSTADRSTANGTFNQHSCQWNVVVTNPRAHTFGVFVKMETSRYVQLRFSEAIGLGHCANFDLQAGTAADSPSNLGVSVSPTITSYSDGWFRLSVTKTLTAASGNVSVFFVENLTAATNEANSQNGSALLWGASLIASANDGYKSGFAALLADHTGGGNHAVQTNPSRQPRIVTNGVIEAINGNPVLKCSGAQFLEVPSFQYVGTDGAWTVNAVFGQNGTLADARIVDADNVFSTRLGQFLRVIVGTLNSIGFSGAAAFIAVRSGQAANTPYVATGVRRTNQIQAFLNGAGGTAVATTGTASSFPAPLRLGAGLDGSGFLDGWIGEVTVWGNALPDTNRQALERNQAAYYGIAVN
jgi:hypothetical protein